MIVGARQPWAHVMAVAVTLLLLLSFISYSRPQDRIATLKTNTLDKVCDRNSSEPTVYHFTGKTDYKQRDRPAQKVVGLMFVGRQQFVRILECYVKRNLVTNGGWLDEVIWMIHTQEQGDINFLEKIIKSEPLYSSHIVTSYRVAYDFLERNTTYVKLDDDVVFFEDSTIPAIVSRLNQNPQYSIVSANVMNQPALAFVHYHLGAIHPYLPEVDPPADFEPNRTVDNWRVSHLPRYHGALNEDLEEDFEAPYKGHRWIRAPREADIIHTPAGRMGHDGSEYNAFNSAWKSWAIAAQQHYSFLENLERNELWRYKFDSWHYHYERLSVNFIAFHGDTIIDNPITEDDDEWYLTQIMTKAIRRPAILDGTGMAVHFGFGPQTKLLNTTDLLGRYQNYAEEFVCGRRWGSPRP